jgi:hypothetical protein
MFPSAIIGLTIKLTGDGAMNELEQAFETIRNIKSPIWSAGGDAPASELSALLCALRDVTHFAERNICSHEETHRGGVLWEICDMCGAKWADDEGGKPAWVEPPEIVSAREMLKKYDA